MATESKLHDKSRVIGVAADKDTLHQLLKNEIDLLQDGGLSGLNGIPLGVAAKRKVPGGCLLGEMLAPLMGVPYPQAAHIFVSSSISPRHQVGNFFPNESAWMTGNKLILRYFATHRAACPFAPQFPFAAFSNSASAKIRSTSCARRASINFRCCWRSSFPVTSSA
jgi:hypothetical protein